MPSINSADATTNGLRKDPQDGDTPPNSQNIKPSIKKSVEDFVCEVDALADTLPLVMPLVTVSMAQTSKELNAFLIERCEKLDNESFSIPPDEYIEFSNFQRRLQRTIASTTAKRPSTQTHSSRAFALVFYMKPEVLNSSEHHLTFKDLMTFPSLTLPARATKEISGPLSKSPRSVQVDGSEI